MTCAAPLRLLASLSTPLLPRPRPPGSVGIILASARRDANHTHTLCHRPGPPGPPRTPAATQMAEDAPMAENGASGELENGAENEELKKVAGDLSELALKIWTSMEETKALDASDNGLDDDMARGPAGAPAPDVKRE